jgi:hypothetical protein
VGTLLIVIGCLLLFVAGACLAFAWNARRISGVRLTDYRVSGDAGAAPLSGEPSAWWRVRVKGGGERCSSATMTLVNGVAPVELPAEHVDPHPDEVHRFACATDPLEDAENALPRELHHGEVADTPYTAEEYSLAPGARVTIGPKLFAAGKAADIAANAARAQRQMSRLAAQVGAAGVLVLVLGIFLR